eukprot:symbB.v1.2.025355.t1/scaffold2449.1/size78888/4
MISKRHVHRFQQAKVRDSAAATFANSALCEWRAVSTWSQIYNSNFQETRSRHLPHLCPICRATLVAIELFEKFSVWSCQKSSLKSCK